MSREAAAQTVVALAALACLIPRPAAATSAHDPDAALRTSQAAIGNSVGDLTFTDAHGAAFRLERLRGKPLIISFIYTSCHHVCPTLTRNLSATVEIAGEALGEDAFNVVTIGFDWAADSPDRMRMFAASQGIVRPNWHFLSGDKESVSALSEDTGFLFSRSAKGFDHLLQISIVDAKGRVYRQVYGDGLDAPAIVEPLKELVFDSPGDANPVTRWIDTFKLFCTVFDPNSGRYRFDYSIVVTILTGLVSLMAIGFFIFREWRRVQ